MIGIPKNLFIWKIIQNENYFIQILDNRTHCVYIYLYVYVYMYMYIRNDVMPLPHELNSVTKKSDRRKSTQFWFFLTLLP